MQDTSGFQCQVFLSLDRMTAGRELSSDWKSMIELLERLKIGHAIAPSGDLPSAIARIGSAGNVLIAGVFCVGSQATPSLLEQWVALKDRATTFLLQPPSAMAQLERINEILLDHQVIRITCLSDPHFDSKLKGLQQKALRQLYRARTVPAPVPLHN